MGKSCLDAFKKKYPKEEQPPLVKQILGASDIDNSSSQNVRRFQKTLTDRAKQLDSIEALYRTQVIQFVDKLQYGELKANKFVEKRPNDQDNELNTFKAYGTAKLLKNLFQRIGSIYNFITPEFLKRNGFTRGEKKVLNNFNNKFLPHFDKALEEIFNNKSHQFFRNNDFVKYFTDATYPNGPNNPEVTPFVDSEGIESKMDPTTKGVLAATVYDFMMNSSHMFLPNDISEMKKILGITEKEEGLPDNAADHLYDIGSKGSTIALTLGKAIAARLGISPGPDSDYHAKIRMEASFGLLGLAVLEKMNVLERTDVFLGTDKDGNPIPWQSEEDRKNKVPIPKDQEKFYGLAALKEDLTPEESEALDIRARGRARDGHRVVSFFRFANPTFDQFGNQSMPAEYVDSAVDYSLSPDAISKLFGGDQIKKNYSFTQPVYGKDYQFRIGYSTKRATKRQSERLKKYNQKVWDVSKNASDAFFGLSGEAQRSLLGYMDPKKASKAQEKTVRGVNIGIENDIKYMTEMLRNREMREKRGESTGIYIESRFWNTMRMGMQGTVNPQGSKFHRALLSMEGWERTFTKTGDYDDRSTMGFIYGVAQHLDIEASKLGGIDEQRKKFLKEMRSKKGKEALKLAGKLHKEGSLSAEEEAKLLKHVTRYKNKTLSLKALIEYSRYQSTRKGQEFTTDMTVEVDGITNGVAIAMMQLAGTSTDFKKLVAALTMAGIEFTDTAEVIEEKLRTKGLLDAYTRLGHAWASEIAMLRADLMEKGNVKALQNTNAIEKIVGPLFDDTGHATSAARTLSKYRTMQSLFGAGNPKQSRIFIEENVIREGIVEALVDFAQTIESWEVVGDSTSTAEKKRVRADLRNLLESVGQLTGKNLGNASTITPKALRNINLTTEDKTAISNAASEVYGSALAEALDTSYSSMKNTREPLNSAASVMVTIYNKILSSEITKVVEQNTANDTEMVERNRQNKIYNAKNPSKKQRQIYTVPITVKQMRAIVKKMEALFPAVRSPFYEADSDTGYLDIGRKDTVRRENGAKVTQTYNDPTIEQQKLAVSEYPYLKDPGVSAVVNMIHMLDSYVANHYVGTDHDFFNVHDALIGSIEDIGVMETIANGAFRGAMESFNLVAEFDRAFTKFREELNKKDNEYSVDSMDLIDSLVDSQFVYLDEVANYFNIRSTKTLMTLIYKNTPYNKRPKKHFDALKTYLDKELKTEDDKKHFLYSVINNFHAKLSEESDAATENKKELTGAAVRYMQYSAGMGGITTGNKQASVLFAESENPVTPATITEEDMNATNNLSDMIAKTNNKTNEEYANATQERSEERTKKQPAEEAEQGDLFGSSINNVSVDPKDYNGSRQIDQKTAVEILNGLVAMDVDSGYAAINASPDHLEHLQNLVKDITNNVMRPLEIYVGQHPNAAEETAGVLVSDKKGKNSKIFIQRQNPNKQSSFLNNGIRMSSAETYAHELVHHMTHMVLSNNAPLRNIARNLFNQTYDALREKYKDEAYRVFLNDPTIDVTDAAFKYEVEAAQARWDYVFEGGAQRTKEQKVSMYDEFVAFSTTNENFMNELSKLNVRAPVKSNAMFGIFEKNIQTSFANLIARIQEFIFGKVNHQVEAGTMDVEMNRLVSALARQDSAKKNALLQYAWDAQAKVKLWADAGDIKIKKTVTKLAKKTAPAKVWKLAKSLPELDNMISQGMRNLRGWYNDKEYGFAASMITETRGLTDRVAALHDLQRKRNLILDMEKKEQASRMLDIVNGFFKRELSDGEKTAITKVFVKTDLSSVYRSGGIDHVYDMVTSTKLRRQRIDELKSQLFMDPDLNEYHHFFDRASEALGMFMVQGRSRETDVPLSNAYNIARMAGTSKEGILTPALEKKVATAVDEMASLYALNYVSNQDSAIAGKLMDENIRSLENIMLQHQELKNDAFENNFQGKSEKMLKGYTKAILNPRIDYIQGTAEDAEILEARGYIRNARPLPPDPKDPEQRPLYIYKSTIGMAASYSSTILSLTNNVARGIDAFKIQALHKKGGASKITKQDSTLQAIADNETLIDVVKGRLEGMFNPRGNTRISDNDHGNYVIPKFGDEGEITGTRYIMNETTKDEELEQRSEVDGIFAKMVETAVDKAATAKINEELIYALKEMYDKDFKNNPTAYVEISPQSDNERYQDIYYMIPPAARQVIADVFPDGKLIVAKDVIDISFGMRKYSIVDTLIKSPEDRNVLVNTIVGVAGYALGFDPFGKSKYKNKQGRILARARFAETVMEQIASLAKNNIVVRNLSVVAGNYTSNIAFLASRGLTLEEIHTLSTDAMQNTLEYEKTNSELQKLIQKRALYENNKSENAVRKKNNLRKVDRRIEQLRAELELNPVTVLMREGLMTSIVDDIDTDLTKQKYEHNVNAAISATLGKLPSKVQTIAKTMFIAEDTKGYKVLNNGVKMTDFIGRYALYNHYVKEKGMDPAIAARQVNEEFINFALPTHRMLEYGNSIGLIWFSKYQLRVLKQVASIVADKPLTSIAVFAITSMMGMGNIMNSIPGVTKNLMQAFSNPIDMLMGSITETAVLDAADTLLD